MENKDYYGRIMAESSDANLIRFNYEGNYGTLCLLVSHLIKDIGKRLDKNTEDILIDIGRFLR